MDWSLCHLLRPANQGDIAVVGFQATIHANEILLLLSKLSKVKQCHVLLKREAAVHALWCTGEGSRDSCPTHNVNKLSKTIISEPVDRIDKKDKIWHTNVFLYDKPLMLDYVRMVIPKHLWWARIRPLSWEHQLGFLTALSVWLISR